MTKQIDILSFRVEPELKNIYEELPADAKRKVKLGIIESILKEHHTIQFNAKDYAKSFGISFQIEEEG